jgi:Zn-dependent protease
MLRVGPGRRILFAEAAASVFGQVDLNRAIEMIIILLIAIDIHELAHAVVADRLGDNTPRRMGQLSLNPFVHMDQVGIILLLLTALSSFGFTYGRTHVTPSNFRFGPQRGGALVAIVGPLSNLLLGALLALVLRLHIAGTVNLPDNVAEFVALAVFLNLLLFVINLIPIPPLDGFTVLGGFLTARQMYSLAPLQQWGPLIILLLFIADPQIHVVGNVVDPAISQIGNWVTGYPLFGISLPIW